MCTHAYACVSIHRQKSTHNFCAASWCACQGGQNSFLATEQGGIPYAQQQLRKVHETTANLLEEWSTSDDFCRATEKKSHFMDLSEDDILHSSPEDVGMHDILAETVLGHQRMQEGTRVSLSGSVSHTRKCFSASVLDTIDLTADEELQGNNHPAKHKAYLIRPPISTKQASLERWFSKK